MKAAGRSRETGEIGVVCDVAYASSPEEFAEHVVRAPGRSRAPARAHRFLRSTTRLACRSLARRMARCTEAWLSRRHETRPRVQALQVGASGRTRSPHGIGGASTSSTRRSAERATRAEARCANRHPKRRSTDCRSTTPAPERGRARPNSSPWRRSGRGKPIR